MFSTGKVFSGVDVGLTLQKIKACLTVKQEIINYYYYMKYCISNNTFV